LSTPISDPRRLASPDCNLAGNPLATIAVSGIVRSFLADLARHRTAQIASCGSHARDCSALENRQRLLSTLHEFSMKIRAEPDREFCTTAATILGVIGGGLTCSSDQERSMVWCYERAVDRLEPRIAQACNRVQPWEVRGLGIRISDAVNEIASDIPQDATIADLGDAAIEAAALLALIAGTTYAEAGEESPADGGAR